MSKSNRPEIHDFNEYRAFLRAWFDFLKATDKSFSLRKLSLKMGMGTGFLSLVLSGQRGLTIDAQTKLFEHIGLSRAEEKYFDALRALEESPVGPERIAAFERLRRFHGFKEKKQNELEAYRYLTKWYYVAIHEMALQKEFKFDAEWIAEKLLFRVPVQDVREAMEFLTKQGFLVVGPGGEIQVQQKQIDCFGGVYKLSLNEFYRQIFDLAHKSIEAVPSDERQILGHTCLLSEDQLAQVKAVLSEAQGAIEKIGAQRSNQRRVYQINLSAFPMTRKGETSEDKS